MSILLPQDKINECSIMSYNAHFSKNKIYMLNNLLIYIRKFIIFKPQPLRVCLVGR